MPVGERNSGEQQAASTPVFPVSFTHQEFPVDGKTSGELGAPLGMIAKPFLGRPDGMNLRSELTRNTERVSQMARCSHCSAYINPYCDITNVRWFCGLCGTRNTFTKNMSRYRAGDPRNLPEMQQLVVDFVMPLNGEYRSVTSSNTLSSPHDTTTTTNNSNDDACYRVSTRTSPQVHVFLIQESMSHDSLRAVIEGLSQTVREMHDDAHIALVSYSNKISVYKCSFDSYEFDPQKRPTILHANFHLENFTKDMKLVKEDGSSSSSTEINAAWEDVEQQQQQQQHDVNTQKQELTTNTKATASKSSINQNDKPKVTTPWHLGHVSPFMDSVRRVGDARTSILEALECVADYISDDTATINNNTKDEDGSTAPICTNMIGPAIEATIKWIIESPPHKLHPSCSTSAHDSTKAGSIFSTSGIFNLVSDIGKALVGVVDDEDEDDSEDETYDDVDLSKDVPEPQLSLPPRGPAPIDVCSGINLHVFYSDVHDLPPNSHPSTNGHQAAIDSMWLKSLTKQCSLKGLAVNVWGVASFDTDVLGLCSWLPLVRNTGGKIYRSVLGQIPKDERALLTEKLKRAMLPQIATKCLMKVRCSPQIIVGDSSATGNMMSDENLPGVYRTATCSTDSTFAFTLEHRLVGGGRSDGQKMTGVVTQIAFQYNTLVEATNADLANIEAQDKKFAEYIKEQNEAMKDTAGYSISSATDGKSAISSSSTNKRVYYAETMRDVLGIAGYWSELKRIVQAQNKSNSNTSHAGRSEKRAVAANDKGNNCSNNNSSSSGGGGSNSEEDLTTRGDWLLASNSCHNGGKRLMVVRRQRVITINVNCTVKRMKIANSMDPPTVAAILVRQMMEEFADILQGEGLRSKISLGSSYRALLRETKELLHEWAGAHISCMMKLANDPFDKDLVDQSLEIYMKSSQQLQLLKLLCGATNIGRAHRSLGWNPDKMAEMASFISSCDAYQIATLLYPVLLSVNAAGEVDATKAIPLKRDSMLTNAPPDTPTFLLLTGNELVIYNTLAAGSGSSSSGNGNVADANKLPSQPQSTMAGGLLSFLGGQGAAAADAASRKASSAGIMNSKENSSKPGRIEDSVESKAQEVYAHNSEDDKKVKQLAGREDVKSSGVSANALLMGNKYWLPNYIHDQLLTGSNVPRPVLSEAGTFSSVHFMPYLVEDGDGCGDENDGTIQSYNTFVTKVSALARSQLIVE